MFEWWVRARSGAVDRGPQLLGVVELMPDAQTAGFQQRTDEGLESRGGGVHRVGLPPLYGAHADAHTGSELALSQSAPPAVTQKQAAETLVPSVCGVQAGA